MNATSPVLHEDKFNVCQSLTRLVYNNIEATNRHLEDLLCSTEERKRKKKERKKEKKRKEKKKANVRTRKTEIEGGEENG